MVWVPGRWLDSWTAARSVQPPPEPAQVASPGSVSAWSAVLSTTIELGTATSRSAAPLSQMSRGTPRWSAPSPASADGPPGLWGARALPPGLVDGGRCVDVDPPLFCSAPSSGLSFRIQVLVLAGSV